MLINITKKLTLPLLLCLIGLPQFANGVIVPVLPSLTKDLHISPSSAQFIVTIYFVGFSFGVLFWGVLADRIGRRKSILTGFFVFILSSLGCLISDTISWLAIFRLFNGLGASAGSVSTTLIRDHFKDHAKRNKIMTSMAMGLALCPALGNLLGGYVAEYANWHHAFLLLFITGLSVFVFGFFKMPETADIESLATEKVLVFDVLKRIIFDRRVICSAIVIAGFNGLLHGILSELPFLAENILHMPAETFGYIGAVSASCTIFGAFWAKKLTSSKESSYQIISLGIGLCNLSAILMLFFTLSSIITANNYFYAVCSIVFCLVLFFIGFGLAIPITLSAALINYNKVQGTAGAIFGSSYYIMISGMVEIMRFLHNGNVTALPTFLCIGSAILFLSALILKLELIHD